MALRNTKLPTMVNLPEKVKKARINEQLAVKDLVKTHKDFEEEIKMFYTFFENYELAFPDLQEKIDKEIKEIKDGKPIYSSEPTTLFNLIVITELYYHTVQDAIIKQNEMYEEEQVLKLKPRIVNTAIDEYQHKIYFHEMASHNIKSVMDIVKPAKAKALETFARIRNEYTDEYALYTKKEAGVKV